jgi:hypothetical protein
MNTPNESVRLPTSCNFVMHNFFGIQWGSDPEPTPNRPRGFLLFRFVQMGVVLIEGNDHVVIGVFLL